MKNHERMAIQELVARYTDALVRNDADAWAATWAEDAQWDLGGFVVDGIDAIVELWRRATAPFACIVQVASNPIIRIDDEGRAYGRWTIVEHLGTESGEGTMQNIGVYDDTYTLVDGEWRFAKRRYQPLFTGAHGLTAPPAGYSSISPLP